MNPELLWDKYLNHEMTDTDIIVNDGTNDNVFQCHRLILSSSQGYFGALFKSGMKECFSDEIRLGLQISKDAFIHVLHYIYTGTTSKAHPSITLEVLKCATFFQLPGLEKAAELDLRAISSPQELIELMQNFNSTVFFYLPQNLIDLIF